MSETEQGREWLLEPAAPTEARIVVEIGPEAQLKPEVREALEALAEALMEEDEVSGFAALKCPTLGCNLSCNPYSAKRGAIAGTTLGGFSLGFSARIAP